MLGVSGCFRVPLYHDLLVSLEKTETERAEEPTKFSKAASGGAGPGSSGSTAALLRPEQRTGSPALLAEVNRSCQRSCRRSMGTRTEPRRKLSRTGLSAAKLINGIPAVVFRSRLLTLFVFTLRAGIQWFFALTNLSAVAFSFGICLERLAAKSFSGFGAGMDL